MEKDIRWRQRFINFEKAMNYLEEAVDLADPDTIQKAGMIQFFEMTFELGWNMIKDYLQQEGITDIKSPRAAIKKGFETGILQDGYGWMQMLEDRNITSHAYDEETVSKLGQLISEEYFPLLKKLRNEFKDKQKSRWSNE